MATTAPGRKEGHGLILTGLLLGVLLAALDQTVVGTSLPKIVSDLQDFEHFASLVTAYLLASTIVIPLAGKFSDNYGRRPVYLAGMGVFLLGSMLCGTATSMTQLILWRFVQGLGGGAIFPVAIATIADLYAPSDRGRVQGLFGAVFGLSSVVGPFIGGWIVDYVHVLGIASWRWVFYVNLPVGLVALFMVFTHFPRKTERHPHPIDWLGIATVTTALTAIVLVAVWGGGEYQWDSPQILGLIALALLSVAAFVFVESRAKDPLVPLALFKEPIFTVSAIASILMGGAMFGVISFMPTYMQGVVGISATYSGAVLMPLSLTIVAGSIVSGRMMKRFGYKPFTVIGTVIIGTAFLVLWWQSSHGIPPIWQAILAMMWLGIGIGFTIQTFVVAVQNAVERRYVGVGTSSITLFRTLGATVGVAALGAILNRRLEQTLPDTMPPGSVEQLMGDPRAHLSRLADFPRLLTTPEFMDAQFPGHDAIVTGLKDGFSQSIATVWMAGAVMAAVGFVIVLFLRSKPLKTAEEYHNAPPVMHAE